MKFNSESKQPLLEKKPALIYPFPTKQARKLFPFLTLLINSKELMGEIYRFFTVSDLMVMSHSSKDLAQYRKTYAKNYITNTQLMTILEGAARYTELSFFLGTIVRYLKNYMSSRDNEIPASLLPEVTVVDEKHENSEDYKEEDEDKKSMNTKKMLKVLSPIEIARLKEIVEAIRGKCEPYCDDCERTICLMAMLTAAFAAWGACIGWPIGCCVSACAGKGCSCCNAYACWGAGIGEGLGGSGGLYISGRLLYEESFRYLCDSYLNRYRLFSSLAPAELERYKEISGKENLQLIVNPPQSR